MLAGNAWRQLAIFGPGTTTCTVTGLSTSTMYSFEVGAYNWQERPGRPPKAATDPGGIVAPPAAPSLTATAVSASQINLAWGGVSGATGYLVDEWINGAWTQIGSFGSGTTGCAVTGLSASTTYYFDVAAYNSAGTTWANYAERHDQRRTRSSGRPVVHGHGRFRIADQPGVERPSPAPAVTWSMSGSTAPGSRSAASAAAPPATRSPA